MEKGQGIVLDAAWDAKVKRRARCVSLSMCILLVAYDPLVVVLGPGLCMSLADSSPRVMQIVGPRGLLHFLASMRFHVFRFVRRVYIPIPPILNPISCA